MKTGQLFNLTTYLNIIAVTGVLLFSTPIRAQETNESVTNWERLRGQTIKNCEYWTTNQNGYFVCAGSPDRITMAEARSLKNVVEQLQDEVDSLKNRVKELEATQN